MNSIALGTPHKIQVKVNLLRSQVNRLEHQIDIMLNMSINTQRIADKKSEEIKVLEEQQRNQCKDHPQNSQNDQNNGKWFESFKRP